MKCMRAARRQLGSWITVLPITVLLGLAVPLPPQASFPAKADARASASGHIPLAYFYKPPQDGTSAHFLARHMALIILMHNDESYARRLRQDGYTGLILQCLAANEAEGPGPYLYKSQACRRGYTPYQRTVVNQPDLFCRAVHPHESWFLHNRKGQRLYTSWHSAGGILRNIYYMNPASPGWRRFVVSRLLAERALGYDGFFLDNVALSRDGLFQDPLNPGGVREYSSARQWKAAMRGYLAFIRSHLPRNVPLWANLVHDDGGGWAPYLPFLNGMMVEDFALGWRNAPLDPAQRKRQFTNIRLALAHGKSVIAVVQGGRREPERLSDALRAYCSLASPNLYFRYADAHDADYRNYWPYPQLFSSDTCSGNTLTTNSEQPSQ